MLEEDEQETVADIEFGNTLAKSFFSNRRNLIIIVSSALVLLTAAILMLVFLLPEPLPHKRYCAMGDYRIEPSMVSIEDYSEQNNLELLYFDWYKDAEYVVETHYKLVDTDEVICLKEELIDSSGNYILYYITDNNTEIDFLSGYEDYCLQSLQINSVDVSYGINQEINTCIKFSYNDWNYYLSIENIVEQDYVENLLKTLIRV